MHCEKDQLTFLPQPTIQLFEGDCLQVMKGMQDNSIDFVCCDPPYALTGKSGKGGFMGKEWDSAIPEVDIWKETLRICKPGSMLAAFGGSRTHHHLMLALEQAGWEIRDVIMYMYGTGFPKSLDISKAIDKVNGYEREKEIRVRCDGKLAGGTISGGFIKGIKDPSLKLNDLPLSKLAKQFDGYKSCLKPAYEFISIAQKPLPKKTEQDIILANLSKIWCNLCLLLPVKDVEKNLKLVNLGIKEALDFVHMNASQLSNIKESLLDLTDMLQLEKILITCLNIVWSWKHTLEELWKNGNMFITKMELDQIIDLKILSYYLSQLTPRSIVQEETKVPGSWLNVLPVARYMNAVLMKINAIQELSVLENAILKDGANAQTLGLSPSYEPIILAMKPLDGTYANNAQTWGVAGMNVEECRIPTNDNLNGGAYCTDGRPNEWGGFKSKTKSNEDFKQPIGRYPSNVILDEFSAELLDQQSGVSKSTSNIRNNKARQGNCLGKETDRIGYGHDDTGGASRFFKKCDFEEGEFNRFLYTAKASPSERDGSKHPCIKPQKLLEYLLKLLSPPGNPVCLDPFMGSGSCGIACKSLGINFIGIEKEHDYFLDAQRRIGE